MAERSNLQWGLRFFSSEGGKLLTAEVSFRKKVVCHLSHPAGNMTSAQIREILLARVLAWIADYQRRDHSGDTVVGDLGT